MRAKRSAGVGKSARKKQPPIFKLVDNLCGRNARARFDFTARSAPLRGARALLRAVGYPLRGTLCASVGFAHICFSGKKVAWQGVALKNAPRGKFEALADTA